MGFPTANMICGGFPKRRAIAVVIIALALVGTAAILNYTDCAAILVMIPCYWIAFLFPSLPVCLAVWFLGRRRVPWNKLDFLILLLPYFAYMALAILVNLPKSLSNVAIELPCLGLAVNLAPIIRLVLPKKWNGRIIATTLLILACAVAAGIYFSVPCLPE
jgi:hypothetical protein